MPRGRGSSANSGIEAQTDERDRLARKSIHGVNVFCCSFLLACITTAAILGIIYVVQIKCIAPQKQIRFSVVSALMSELDPALDTPPVLHIVFQAERASEDSIATCFCHSYTEYTYDGITASTTDEKFCFDMEQSNEFALPLPLYREYQLYYIRNLLYKERDTVVFNLLMHFHADYMPANIYNVSCSNVKLGAPDVPIPCEVSMAIKLVD